MSERSGPLANGSTSSAPGGRLYFLHFAAARRRLPEKLVSCQPHALLCLNKYRFCAAHLLVAPRAHVGDVGDLPPEEYDATIASA